MIILFLKQKGYPVYNHKAATASMKHRNWMWVSDIAVVKFLPTVSAELLQCSNTGGLSRMNCPFQVLPLPLNGVQLQTSKLSFSSLWAIHRWTFSYAWHRCLATLPSRACASSHRLMTWHSPSGVSAREQNSCFPQLRQATLASEQQSIALHCNLHAWLHV